MNSLIRKDSSIIKVKEGKKTIINGYNVLKKIGSGAFSKVKLVEKDNQQYAMKIIDKAALMKKTKGLFFKNSNDNPSSNYYLDDAWKEIAILKKVDHKNIISLIEIIDDDEKDKMYLILQNCANGNLWNYDENEDTFSVNKNIKTENNWYTEIQIRDFIRDIVWGINYLHHNGIIHRDIKPDNILIDSCNNCLITDFNVSTMLVDNENDNIGKKISGTDHFRAPECCNEEGIASDLKGKPLDIWALGVTSYILAYMKLPFQPENNWDIIGLFDWISKGEYSIPNDRMSKGFEDFLKRCLTKEIEKRITIKEIMELEWINIGRTHLSSMEKPHWIEVTDSEVGSCLNFFIKMNWVKKCGSKWKQLLKSKVIEEF